MDEGAAGRQPALLGSRLGVAGAIETIRQNDGSVEEAASYLEIPVEQLETAARYYGEYTDEVDESIERATGPIWRQSPIARSSAASPPSSGPS